MSLSVNKMRPERVDVACSSPPSRDASEPEHYSLMLVLSNSGLANLLRLLKGQAIGQEYILLEVIASTARLQITLPLFREAMNARIDPTSALTENQNPINLLYSNVCVSARYRRLY